MTDAEYARANFDYDAESGRLYRRLPGGGRRPILGRHSAGYIQVSFRRRPTVAHRIAWLWSHGDWPSGYIDHINGDRADNRLQNLRDVSQSVNMHNLKRAKVDNKLGVLGVSRNRDGYRARISVDGEAKHLGTFQTIQEASEVYRAAKRAHGLEAA